MLAKQVESMNGSGAVHVPAGGMMWAGSLGRTDTVAGDTAEVFSFGVTGATSLGRSALGRGPGAAVEWRAAWAWKPAMFAGGLLVGGSGGTTVLCSLGGGQPVLAVRWYTSAAMWLDAFQ